MFNWNRMDWNVKNMMNLIMCGYLWLRIACVGVRSVLCHHCIENILFSIRCYVYMVYAEESSDHS